jgi:glycosyltransferase involved in cell wall biosynthesis
VICSNRTSVPEVAGEGALIHEPDDYAGIAADIQRLQDGSFRDSVTAGGLRNARNYTGERMIGAYEEAYDRI